MLENRSFDHMLGYLQADGVLADVDGLDPATCFNEWPDGRKEYVAPMGERYFHHKIQDPGHGAEDVKDQLAGRNGGFLKNYVEVLERHKQEWREEGKPIPPDEQMPPEAILGYQQAHDVPVFDFIARTYHVCDKWFSSVPGPTWPNRLYATTGGIADRVHVALPGDLGEKLREAPIYDGEGFTRWLKKDQWRWYSHDPATLRMIDSAYRPGGDPDRYSDTNFAYFNRRTLLEWRTFLGDASGGRLRRVSWIDPNFVDFRILGPPGSSDDHPPSRVMLGQELVLEILLAITRSRKTWERTLLLITYDEHGGFYDHVWPGDVACPGEEGFPLGVRVPALVVSPWVPQGVSHTTFDHTAIIKTVLEAVADENRRADAYAKMGPRVRAANDLGDLLSLDAPREPPRDELYALADTIVKWKRGAYERNMLEAPTRGEEGWEAVTDLQSEIVAAANKLRADGIPPGKP
jgi:phospholipase C